MTSFGLAISAFRRHRARTFFTILSVATAFAVFTILCAISEGVTGQISLASARRLITDSESSSQYLPVSYASTIASIPGVMAVEYWWGFGGYFREPKNRVGVNAESQSIWIVYPEMSLTEEEKERFAHDRQGAIIGQRLAEKMSWKVGDSIVIQGGPVQKDGSATWHFHIDGIYRTDLPIAYQETFYANYDYLNKGIADQRDRNSAYRFDELVSDPRDLDRVARAIDARFSNAPVSTITSSEQEDMVGAVRQFGNVGAMVTSVGAAVFFTMLLVTGNLMVNSVRERRGELAMMRALGFAPLRLTLLVLQESTLLIGTGAILGILTGWEASRLLAPHVVDMLSAFAVTWYAVGLAAALAVVFAVLTSLAPGVSVARLQIAEALRGM